MVFYFAWVSSDERFDSITHARHDEHILHFDIDHQEGAVPLLRLTVAKFRHSSQPLGQRGILWQKEGDHDHVLFDGVLTLNPAAKKEDFLLLILEAGTVYKASQFKSYLTLAKQRKFEPLLVAEQDQQDSHEVLEACSSLPHWSRVEGMLTFHEIGVDHPVLKIGSRFFADTLEITHKGKSLSSIRVHLTAEWVQRYDGVVDVSPMIQREGRRGYLSTLTADDFQKKWWRKGYPLQRTGYEILESGVRVVTPPSTGGLNVYPLKSADFKVNGVHQSLARTWMQPLLKLQWHYRQKRKETVHIHLPCGGEGEALDISMRLQDIASPVAVSPWKEQELYYPGNLVLREGHIYQAHQVHVTGERFDPRFWEKKSVWPTALEDPSHWTFFQTPRGKQVIDHVLRRAHAYEMMAARTMYVRCCLPFERGRALSCAHRVSLTDARLPGGSIIGKVVHYRLIAEGDTGERWAEMTLAVSKATMPWKLRDLKLKKAAEGILEPKKMTARDVVTALHLTHDADEQNRHIEGKNFPSMAAVKRALEKVPTRLRIELKNLKSSPELAHEWEAVVEREQ